MKFAWIDIRTVPAAQRAAIVEAALHAGARGIVDDDTAVLDTLPPTVTRILAPRDGTAPDPDTTGSVDLVVHELSGPEDVDGLRGRTGVAGRVHVVDQASLDVACHAASTLPATLVEFQDPTKIPLEIVIAAADKSAGELVCQAADAEEASIIVDVLEKGSDGVLLAPRSVDDVPRLMGVLTDGTAPLELTTLTVSGIEHIGLGDRVCVDTCTHFEKDEGMLIGSYSQGFVLCASETHPLPYMPTRPFRVNAGALHSYTVGLDNRTNYLSELHNGSAVLAVAADGRTRRVAVGRVKMESRPLLSISASAPDGTAVSLTVQDDWHVRVLGPGASVHNVTELRAGDEILGYLATDQRHVGWPVGEFCLER